MLDKIGVESAAAAAVVAAAAAAASADDETDDEEDDEDELELTASEVSPVDAAAKRARFAAADEVVALAPLVADAVLALSVSTGAGSEGTVAPMTTWNCRHQIGETMSARVRAQSRGYR